MTENILIGSSFGYRLYEKNGHWEFSGDPARSIWCVGTLTEVCKYAFDLGFDLREINTALICMEELDHDAASFGVLKRFMYSYNRSDVNGKNLLAN